MTKTHYIATDANGTVHKRSTDRRAYSHTVVVKKSKEGAIERAKQTAVWERKNLQQMADQTAAGVEAYVADGLRRHPILGREYFEKSFTETANRVAAFRGGVDGEVAALLAQRLAAIEATDWNVWFNAGWCGRSDLAEKLSAQHRTSDYSAVMVLDAVEKGA